MNLQYKQEETVKIVIGHPISFFIVSQFIAPAEGFGLQPTIFFSIFGKKRVLSIWFYLLLLILLCSVITLITLKHRIKE